MPSTQYTRRRLLASLGTAGVAATAGCASLPAGPTDGVTSLRREHLSLPETPRPNDPSDAQVLALRAHLDGLVTKAEPLYARVGDDALPEEAHIDVRAGVPSVRDFLAESAGDPTAMDYGFARSRVSYAGFALGFLRGWFGLDDPSGGRERARDARESLADASAATPRRAVDTAAYLARVGWAERELRFAYVAIDQYAGEDDERSTPDSRTERALRVAEHYRQAAKARMYTTAGRYYARDYRRERADGATRVVDALDGRQDGLLSRVESGTPPRERPGALAEQYDDPAVGAYYRRLGNPLGAVREQAALARTAADHGWHALGAIAALRAAANLAGYEHVRAVTPGRVRDGVSSAELFEAKRHVVRRARALVERDDPLAAWLAGEPVRLVSAGEGYLDADVMDSREGARAVCFEFFRHAAGYVDALPSLLETVESGK